MNICLTCNLSPWSQNAGGGQMITHFLACALTVLKHRVWVVYTGKRDGGQGEATPYDIIWVRNNSIALFDFNAYSVYSAVKNLSQKIIIDVVMGEGSEAAFLPDFCKKIGARFFIGVNYPEFPSISLAGYLRNPLQLLKEFRLLQIRYAAKKAHRVFALSEFSKSNIHECLNIERKKIFVSAPGIDEQWFFQHSNNVKKKSILFWGRIDRQKGVDTLILASQKILQKYPEIELHIAGHGEKITEYKSLADSLGIGRNVIWHGWHSPETIIKELLPHALLCCFPSRQESFGMVIAEAMASGTPVITSLIGPTPDLVDDGKNGILVLPGNMEGFTKAMLSIIEDRGLAAELGKNARQKVKEKFNWNKMATEHLEVFDSIINKR